MKYSIVVDVAHVDTNRGYHDSKGTIAFSYDENEIGRFTEEREQEIVASICGGSHMWYSSYKIAETAIVRTYKVHYGYDSSD